MKLVRYLSGALAVVLLVAAVSLYAMRTARGSDHQDSPTVVSNPTEDITDVFTFPAPDQPGNVVFVVDFYPLIPAGQSGSISFDPNVLYQVKIANNAASDPSEHVVLQMKANAAGSAPSFTLYGPASPNEQGTKNTLVSGGQTFNFNSPTTLPNNVHVFVGPRRDPFFFDLAQFFKIVPDRNYKNQPSPPAATASSFNFASASQTITGLGGVSYGTAGSNSCSIAAPSDFLANYDVESFVVSVPASMLGTAGKMGVWATSSTPSGT